MQHALSYLLSAVWENASVFLRQDATGCHYLVLKDPNSARNTSPMTTARRELKSATIAKHSGANLKSYFVLVCSNLIRYADRAELICAESRIAP